MKDTDQACDLIGKGVVVLAIGLIFFMIILIFSGCDWLVAMTVKAKIERQQYYEELKKQNVYERIANALEKIADNKREQK